MQWSENVNNIIATIFFSNFFRYQQQNSQIFWPENCINLYIFCSESIFKIRFGFILTRNKLTWLFFLVRIIHFLMIFFSGQKISISGRFSDQKTYRFCGQELYGTSSSSWLVRAVTSLYLTSPNWTFCLSFGLDISEIW